MEQRNRSGDHQPHLQSQSRFDRFIQSIQNFKLYKPHSDRPAKRFSFSSPSSHHQPHRRQSTDPKKTKTIDDELNQSDSHRPSSQSPPCYPPHTISMPQPILITTPQDYLPTPSSPIRMPIPILHHPSKPPTQPAPQPILLPQPPLACPFPQPTNPTAPSLNPISSPKKPSKSPVTPDPIKVLHQLIHSPSTTTPLPSSSKPSKSKPNLSSDDTSKPQTPIKPTSSTSTPSKSTPSKSKTPTDPKKLLTPTSSSSNGASNQNHDQPSSPTPSSSVERCSGTTREGKPCSRKPMKTIEPSPNTKTNHLQTKINLADRFDELDEILSISSPNEEEDPQMTSIVPRFCFQHYQKVQSQPGSFFGKDVWVKFSDWIPDELPEATKITLRVEMSKSPSEADRKQTGYLYCHEMRPTKENKNRSGTYVKVGRSIRPVARLEEWSKQCPSRQPIVRGFFPEPHQEHSGPSPSSSVGGTCYLNGVQSVSNQGIRFHKRWERLTLIELAGWQSLQRQGHPKSACVDCGKVHVELFELDLGSFDRVVKPLIEKWLKWCQFAYL